MIASRLSTRPLYLQVRDALIERIAAGEWKPGGALPNESDLARAFGVSVGTVRKALGFMEEERLLTRKQGRGTFVIDRGSHDQVSRFDNIRAANGDQIDTDAGTTTISEGNASDSECRRLSLQPSDRVYRIHSLHLHDDRPFLVDDTVLPAALFPGLPDRRNASHGVVVLAQQYGVLVGRAEERLSIGSADASAAAALGVAAGSPVLVMDRVMLALDGRRIEWRVRCSPLAAGQYYLATIG